MISLSDCRWTEMGGWKRTSRHILSTMQSIINDLSGRYGTINFSFMLPRIIIYSFPLKDFLVYMKLFRFNGVHGRNKYKYQRKFD